jgi:hypothetical protein
MARCPPKHHVRPSIRHPRTRHARRRALAAAQACRCRSSHSRQPSAAAAAATTPWLQLRHPPSAHVGPNPPSWMQAAWAFAIAWAPPAPRHCGPAAPSGLWTAAHAPGAEPLARYAAPVLGQIQRINTLVLTLKSYVSKDSRLSPYMQSALNSE